MPDAPAGCSVLSMTGAEEVASRVPSHWGTIVPVDAVRGRPAGQEVLLLLRPESITLEQLAVNRNTVRSASNSGWR